jgi:hypothetical protein
MPDISIASVKKEIDAIRKLLDEKLLGGPDTVKAQAAKVNDEKGAKSLEKAHAECEKALKTAASQTKSAEARLKDLVKEVESTKDPEMKGLVQTQLQRQMQQYQQALQAASNAQKANGDAMRKIVENLR